MQNFFLSFLISMIVLGLSAVNVDAVIQKKVAPGKVVKQMVKDEVRQIFSLTAVKKGNRVAGMKIKSITPFSKLIDPPLDFPLSEYNVQIKFSGQAKVTGTYHYYGDDVPFFYGGNVCFDAFDAASLRKIPKLKTDIRRVEFCFLDQPKARKIFGPKGSSGKATVVIDNYVLNAYESEIVNEAMLVKRIQ